MGDEQPAESLFGKRVGNFVVERQLGRGGMGVVYLLRHEQLPNTFAALKVLRRELADAPSMRGRFVQEALVAAALGGHRVARPLQIAPEGRQFQRPVEARQPVESRGGRAAPQGWDRHARHPR